MKNLFYLFLILFMVGCATTNSSKGETAGEMLERLKRDYWGMDTVDKKHRQKVILIAKKEIMSGSYKSDFDIAHPLLVEDPGMPEAFSYYFVHFNPYPERDYSTKTSYLVVVDRMHDRIFYSGLFELPGGDSFYRYNDIIKRIKQGELTPPPETAKTAAP